MLWLLPVVPLVLRDRYSRYPLQVLDGELLVPQVEAFESVLDLMVVAERVLGVYRIQERHQRIHVRLDAFAVGDAALHGVYRQSHQAEVPMAERRTRAYLAQPPVVEVFLGIPRAVGAYAVDDDLLVPLGESLLGLFERVPRLPPLLRQVYLLFRGKEVVQLFEREGVRVDRTP